MRKKLFWTALLCSAFTLGVAQSALSVQVYPTEDKISQSKISHFVQDDKGFIWFGTWDGLVRFDGRATKSFKTVPGDSVHLENQRIMKLIRSKSGNLWVSTYGGHCYMFDTNRNCFCNPLAKYGNCIKQIFSLSNGVVWTYDGEKTLLRIDEDGKTWDSREVEVPFEFNKLVKVVLDHIGNEWIMTDKGAYIYTRQRKVQGFPFNFLTSHDQNLYLATRTQLYTYLLNTASVQNLGLKLNTDIEDIMALRDGRIFISQRAQFSIYNPETGDLQSYPIQDAIIRYYFEDNKNRLWLLGNKEGVYLLENGVFRRIEYHGDVVEATSASFQYGFEDAYGTVWIQPGDGYPLAFFDEERQRLEQAYTYENGRRKRIPFYIRSGALDRQHNLWGNIDEVGFCYFTFSQKLFDWMGDIESDRPDLGARSMMLDNNHRLWIGWRRGMKSDIGEVTLYDDKHQVIGYLGKDGRITPNSSQALRTNIHCMLEDSLGRIWLGSRNDGLFLLIPRSDNGMNYKLIHYERNNNDPDALIGNHINDIIEDHLGRIWIGCYGHGLDCVTDFQNLEQLKFVHTPGFSHENSYIRDIFMTKDHILFIGHNNGLWIADLNLDKPVFYLNQCNQDERSLSSNNVTNVYELRDGRVAASTFGGGVNILNQGFTVSDTLRFEHHYEQKDGVPDVVQACFQGKSGKIWLVSENSLLTYSTDFTEKNTYMEGTSCAETLPVVDGSNMYLYLATKYDVLCFLNREHKFSNYEPNIVFTDLSIHRSDSNMGSRPLTPVDTTFQLEAEDRNLTVRFIALDFSNQAGIRYAYRMDKNPNWIQLGGYASVHLADIPAGNHCLEIRCTNADGVWSKKTARMHLDIEPYFYETVWFMLLGWLLVITMAGSIVYSIMHRIDRRRRAAMRNRLSEAKVKFITEVTEHVDTADEIFTRRLMRLINDNIKNESFNMEQAAAELNMSYPVLYRKVKALLDLTPVELVRQVRMQRAQRLLSERPDLSIAEVAYQSGFGSPQYFNRVFKEMNLCTPAEYKKQKSEEHKAQQEESK